MLVDFENLLIDKFSNHSDTIVPTTSGKLNLKKCRWMWLIFFRSFFVIYLLIYIMISSIWAKSDSDTKTIIKYYFIFIKVSYNIILKVNYCWMVKNQITNYLEILILKQITMSKIFCPLVIQMGQSTAQIAV